MFNCYLNEIMSEVVERRLLAGGFFLTFFVFSPRKDALQLLEDPAMLFASWVEGIETKVRKIKVYVLSSFS